ncbi:MAG: CHAT domain-containing protein [bacterium]|nr:CHAT domain-containing protein [bacterium]
MRNLSTIVVCLLFFVTTYAQTTEDLVQQAQSEFNSAQYDKAIKTYDKLVKKGERQAGYSGLILSHIENGWKLGMNNGDGTSDYQQALQYGQQLIALDSNNVNNLLLFGYSLQFNSAFEHALIQYEKARQIDPNNGYVYYRLWTMQPADPNIRLTHEYVEKAFELNPDIYELYMELGDYYKNINNLEKALEFYNKSIEIKPTWKSLFSAGSLYTYSGDLEKAENYLNRCMELFPDFGWGHISLAGIYLAKGESDRAVLAINEALKENPATKQYLDYYKTNYPQLSEYEFYSADSVEVDKWKGYPKYYGKGVELAQAQDYMNAINFFYASYVEYKKTEFPEQQYLQSIQAWLLHCYRNVAFYREAIESGKIALQIAIENDFITDQASIVANMAAIYSEWGDYDLSNDMHKQSIRLLKMTQKEELLHIAYLNLGIGYRNGKSYDSAVYYHELALNQALEINAKEEILAKKELAWSYATNGQFKKAEKRIISALNDLNLKENEWAKMDVYIAASNVYRLMGKFLLANEYASNINDDFFETFGTYRPEVLSYFENLIPIQMNLGERQFAAHNFKVLNSNFRYQINNYFPALSDAGKKRFYDRLKKQYEIYNSYTFEADGLDQSDLNQLYENQLQSKAILFNTSSKLRRTIASSDDDSLKELFQNWRGHRAKLTRLCTSDQTSADEALINEISEVIDSLEVKMSLLTNNTISLNEHFKVKDVHKLLRKDEAAVEILRFRKFDYTKEVFTDTVFYAALILKGSGEDQIYPVLFKNGNELEGAAYRRYSNSIEYGIQDKDSYNKYWRPIKNVLGDVSKVYIASDGIFHKLSLSSLYNAEEDQYLLDEIDLRIVTSTRDIKKKTSKLPNTGTVHLIGYPNFDLSQEEMVAQITRPDFGFDEKSNLQLRGDFELTQLPGTYSEIQEVSNNLRKSKLEVKILMENDALEENVKSIENPAILHLATHGFFNKNSNKNTNPLFNSGLYLAGAAGDKGANDINLDDGILTAFEVMNMYLDDTYLVVLSACETGLGEVQNGEGVFGLQRAFLIAGAESVVMSYWKVNDQTTMLLMEAFYEELVKTRDKHQAFVQAQLKVKAQYPSPKYWGAFSIIGK